MEKKLYMIQLTETYIYKGHLVNWCEPDGKRVTAQRKIKTGDTVRITFLGAKEEEILVKEWNGVWEMDETINVMGENYYFEVVVNEKRSYYGKWAGYRYTKASDTMGGGVRITVTRTGIDEAEVRSAFNKFKNWLTDGAKDNNYWHGLYKKNEFPEEIAYGMPGEENVTPPAEKTWTTGEVIDEGDGRFTVNGIRYELYDDYEYKDHKRVNFKALRVLPLKGQDKYSGTVDVPAKVKYRSRWREVSKIGSDAFGDCPELVEVRLPETITVFSQIWGCPKLERVIVAEGNATYVSVDGVVYNKEMTEMVCYPHAHGRTYRVPDTVTSIWGLTGCTMLEEIVIPETVKGIGSWRENGRFGTFEGCINLKSIHIPGSIHSIGKNTFKGCTGLEKVSFGGGTKKIENCAFHGCTSLKEIIFPESMEEVHWCAFRGCENVEHIVFPKGRYFDLRNVPKKLLPWGQEPFEIDGVRYTPNFDYEKLNAQVAIYNPEKDAPAQTLHPEVEELHIPATVEQYGYTYEVCQITCKFEQFPNLRSLHLPSTVSKICIDYIHSLQEVVVDEDNPIYTSVDGLLYSKDLTELIAVPSGLPIKKFVVRDGVEVIGKDVLANHQELEEVVFPNSVKKVSEKAFSDCPSLKTVHLNEGLERLESYAFGNTALERVKLPLSLKYIGQKRFSGRRPFSGCSKLTAFEMDGESELFTVIDGVLYAKDNSALGLLYCPPVRTVLNIPDGVECILGDACNECRNLEKVVMPDSVTSIDGWAFYNCKNLQQVVLSKNVQFIGSCAFRECTALKELDLTVCVPKYCPRVDNSAFMYCPDLVLKLPRCLEDKRSDFERKMKGQNQVTAAHLDDTDWI